MICPDCKNEVLIKTMTCISCSTDLKIKSYSNAEIIDGRLVKYGILSSWLIKKYRDILGAYCHITLVRE